MKKIFAVLIAMVMVLAMGTTVFAAGDGTITIQNTVNGKTYNVYKVFDATYSGTNVSYTYDGSNATFLAALQGADSPFTATQNTSGTYNIALKAGATATEVSTFLTGQAANLGNPVKTATGDGKTQTLTDVDYGYYYITTTTGAIVTIDSALKDVVVIDKNEVIPPPDKSESVDDGGTWTTEPETGNESVTANVGDTVSYKVTGTITRYVGETLVTSVNFTDTMTAGLTLNQGVVVKIAGTTLVAGTDYTVTYTGQVTQIDIPTATVSADGVPTFKYDTGAAYEITYSAIVNENAVVATPDKNTVELKYNNTTSVGQDVTEVVSYQITLTKVDSTGAVLAGAKFKLYDAMTGGNEIPVVLVPNTAAGYGTEASTVDNVYRRAKSGETGVEMVTGTTGKIIVQGLANGDYFFEETEAPVGFNKLTERTAATTIDGANAAIEVLNQSGTELPSTGGIGETIFYVIGAILILGAGVILVTRRRAAK